MKSVQEFIDGLRGITEEQFDDFDWLTPVLDTKRRWSMSPGARCAAARASRAARSDSASAFSMYSAFFSANGISARVRPVPSTSKTGS